LIPSWKRVLREHIRTPSGHSLVVTVSFNFVLELWQLIVYERTNTTTKLGYIGKQAIGSVLGTGRRRKIEDKELWRGLLHDPRFT